MKICPNCGHYQLSRQEAEMYNALPATQLQLANKFEVTLQHVRTVMTKMREAGVVKEDRKSSPPIWRKEKRKPHVA